MLASLTGFPGLPLPAIAKNGLKLDLSLDCSRCGIPPTSTMWTPSAQLDEYAIPFSTHTSWILCPGVSNSYELTLNGFAGSLIFIISYLVPALKAYTWSWYINTLWTPPVKSSSYILVIVTLYGSVTSRITNPFLRLDAPSLEIIPTRPSSLIFTSFTVRASTFIVSIIVIFDGSVISQK